MPLVSIATCCIGVLPTRYCSSAASSDERQRSSSSSGSGSGSSSSSSGGGAGAAGSSAAEEDEGESWWQGAAAARQPPLILSPVTARIVVIGWMGSQKRYLNKCVGRTGGRVGELMSNPNSNTQT